VDKRNDKTYIVLIYDYQFGHSKLDLYLQQKSTQEKSELFNKILELLYSCHVKKVGVDFRDCKDGIWNLEFESSKICRITSLCDLCWLRESTDGESTKVHPRVFKDTSKKDLITRASRLGGRRYNRCSLQVESVHSDYLRVAIIGNVLLFVVEVVYYEPPPTKMLGAA
jgi:hypothetical protein